ncbi:MAG: metallophosphoesterase, partial [Endomicrobiaceae bacterium]|nr:metallophosphoesterase [Endomicrobiaceae bacterium]
MKKTIQLSVFTIIIFLLCFVKIRAVSNDAYYIITNPGSDMSTEINISWHADVETTFLQYTKVNDVNWLAAKIVKGNCESFSVDSYTQYKGRTIESNGFTKRYHCRVSLIGLEPNTEYKYRAGAIPTQATDIHYFKTGSGNNPFSFLFFTDPQYATESNASIFNNLVNKALERDPDIRLSIVSGDFVDRGGIMAQWDILFRQSNLRKMPFAVSPGNHEYYDASSSPKMFDHTYFNGFYNNPPNGAPGVTGSSYYFKYNNVLFVSIDSEAAFMNATDKAAQKEWFSAVMERNYGQYIVVFMHRSFYGSIYRDISPGLRADWQGLFDKYGVDLVLTGHDHVYRRTKRVYNGAESILPYRGTTYITGGSAGAKYYDLYYEDNNRHIELFDKEFARTSSITLFQVNTSEIKLVTIGTAGQELDSVILPAKRSPAADGFEKESYLNSITLSMDKSDVNKAVFYWGNKWYGHVNSVRLIDENNNVIGYDYLDSSKLGNSLPIPNIEANRIYNYTLKVSFKDGTTAERPLTLLSKLPYGKIENLNMDDSGTDVILSWHADLKNNQVVKYLVYINDELYKELAVGITELVLIDISPYRFNTITLEAIDIFDDIVYSKTLEYGEAAEPVIISYQDEEIELTVGSESNPHLSIEPEQSLNLIYTSSDEMVAVVDVNGKITAVGVGEAVITVTVYQRP